MALINEEKAPAFALASSVVHHRLSLMLLDVCPGWLLVCLLVLFVDGYKAATQSIAPGRGGPKRGGAADSAQPHPSIPPTHQYAARARPALRGFARQRLHAARHAPRLPPRHGRHHRAPGGRGPPHDGRPHARHGRQPQGKGKQREVDGAMDATYLQARRLLAW